MRVNITSSFPQKLDGKKGPIGYLFTYIFEGNTQLEFAAKTEDVMRKWVDSAESLIKGDKIPPLKATLFWKNKDYWSTRHVIMEEGLLSVHGRKEKGFFQLVKAKLDVVEETNMFSITSDSG